MTGRVEVVQVTDHQLEAELSSHSESALRVSQMVGIQFLQR